jgi:hypothetical protein
MSRGRARYSQSDFVPIFKAARKTGVVARIELELPDGTKMVVEAKSSERHVESENLLIPDDELERWRRSKKNAG